MRLTFHPLTRQPWIGLEGESGGQDPLADSSAPDQKTTAAPDSEIEKPEQETEETLQPKTFTQEELDAIVAKRLSREQRKWERQVTRVAEKPETNEPLRPDQFETYEDYAEALAEQKAQKKIQEHEAQRYQEGARSAYLDREEEARIKYDDFETVAYNKNLKITNEMVATIMESESGPEIVYWLGSNPKEAERISKLSPLQQAREIGKIESKLETNPPVKKTSSAPDPINPVKAKSRAPVFDTTDPRSTETMTATEWINAERARQLRNEKARAY